MATTRRLRLAALSGLLLATLLAWAVTWQAQVIQSQKVLIRVLQQDSTELFRRKIQDQRELQIRRRMERLRTEPQPGASRGCLPSQVCG
ncbi:MAG: hypothetical protein ACE14L_02745 [Terriglobales bacterium]